jgi:hypothetical protein
MAERPSADRKALGSAPWGRLVLGLGGLALLTAIVLHIGIEVVLATLRPALPWLPVLAVLELARIGCAAMGSYLAFGPLARRIPRRTLFRAHLLGHSLTTVAPAPSLFNETIKATLITPYTGAGPAAAVGFTNQVATFVSGGLTTIPCGIAIFVLQGPSSIWFYACAIHTIVLIASGLALQAVTRASGPGRWIVGRFPRLAERAEAFREHAKGIRFGARGPTEMLFISRCFQMVQYGVAAHAVGIDVSALRVVATEGIYLVAIAVGVLVPGGLGTTEGVFTLAADLLNTTVARATAVALLMRCMQIVWVFLGSLVAIATRSDVRLTPTGR